MDELCLVNIYTQHGLMYYSAASIAVVGVVKNQTHQYLSLSITPPQIN